LAGITFPLQLGKSAFHMVALLSHRPILNGKIRRIQSTVKRDHRAISKRTSDHGKGASTDEGEATLIWPENLSPESVQDLEYWLTGILNKAKRRAGVKEDATGEGNG
jgi:hypothetical protein